jgi:hypothetical protein
VREAARTSFSARAVHFLLASTCASIAGVGGTPKYLIWDGDENFGGDVIESIRSVNRSPIRADYRSAGRNEVTECWWGAYEGNCWTM